ncbi:MAG: poly(3-hydroxybutyrate) depolymerase [Bacteroidetes bacterium]|nr:poly(3-hydroxybutyrate) depolymerase [Bacteroidota bacterium]
MKYFILTVVAVWSSIFCHGQQILSDSIKIGDHFRSFHFQKPDVGSKDFSLIFILHGSGNSGRQFMKGINDFKTIADQEKIITVFPDAFKKYWNECRKSSPAEANQMDIDEHEFFRAMIRYFASNYGINEAQVFIIGTSGGGHMAFKMGLTMPEKFRAIAAIIANLPSPDNLDCTETKSAVNMLMVNGTEDSINPYEGGRVILGTRDFGSVRSTQETFTYWAGLAGYSGAPKKELLPDLDPADGKTIERMTYAGGKKSVVLYKVIGGKHDYPGDISVHLEAWKFFKTTF